MGVASLPLAFLAYMLRFDEEPLNIMNYMAKQCGFLKIDLIPCDQNGKETDKLSVKDPVDLVSAFKLITSTVM